MKLRQIHVLGKKVAYSWMSSSAKRRKPIIYIKFENRIVYMIRNERRKQTQKFYYELGDGDIADFFEYSTIMSRNRKRQLIMVNLN